MKPVKYYSDWLMFRGRAKAPKISHRTNVKFNIREIGGKFKVIFLRHPASNIIGFLGRYSLVVIC